MTKTILQIVVPVLVLVIVVVGSAFSKSGVVQQSSNQQQAMSCYKKLVETVKKKGASMVYRTQGGANNWMEARYYPKNNSFNIASGLPMGDLDPGAASVFFSDRDLDGIPDRASYYDGSFLYTESMDSKERTISEKSSIMWEISLVMLLDHTKACG